MEQMIKVTGRVRYVLLDENGRAKDLRDINNLVVNVGRNALATWLAAASQSGPFMPYVGLGTGSNAPSASDTTLQTEFSGGGYARPVGVESSSGPVLSNVATFGPGNGTGALTEAGLFSALTSGTLFARQTFSVINKLAGDTLVVTWNITFS